MKYGKLLTMTFAEATFLIFHKVGEQHAALRANALFSEYFCKRVSMIGNIIARIISLEVTMRRHNFKD
jgi:hypothetical protein